MQKTFQIKGMHCTSCAFLIDDEVEGLEGVESSHTDFKKEQTVVTCTDDSVSEADVIAAIAEAGYTGAPLS